jgi:proline iminopeptidase
VSVRYPPIEPYDHGLLSVGDGQRSLPSAGDPGTSLAANTTGHLVADLERLREHLGIDRWLVYGQSWGTTLGLAYAEQYPHRVSELVLLSTVTTTAREVEWLTRDMGRVFPAEWARFRDGVPPADRDGNLAAAYHRLLEGPDLARREQAPGTGAPGRTLTSPLTLGTSPARAMTTRGSGCVSPAS